MTSGIKPTPYQVQVKIFEAAGCTYYSGHNNGNILFSDSLPTSDRILLGKSPISKTYLEVPLICVPYDKDVT